MRRLAVVGLVGLVGLPACERPYLTWTPREPLSARHGRVAVAVDDRRADRALLGHAFGWGGTPREILADRDHARARVERLTKEALVTAGVGLFTPGEPPTARLAVEIDAMACEGLGRAARADVALRLTVRAADGTARLAAQAIAARGEGRGCQAAFEKALDEVLDELGARFVEGATHEALL